MMFTSGQRCGFGEDIGCGQRDLANPFREQMALQLREGQNVPVGCTVLVFSLTDFTVSLSVDRGHS